VKDTNISLALLFWYYMLPSYFEVSAADVFQVGMGGLGTKISRDINLQRCELLLVRGLIRI